MVFSYSHEQKKISALTTAKQHWTIYRSPIQGNQAKKSVTFRLVSNFECTLCQLHALTALAAQYVFKQRKASPIFLFFFQTSLAIFSPLHFHMNFRVGLSTSLKYSAYKLIYRLNIITISKIFCLPFCEHKYYHFLHHNFKMFCSFSTQSRISF